MTDTDAKTTFAELERQEQKYIIKLEDLEDIKKEIEKHLKPAFIHKDTKFIIVNSTYLDSKDRRNFRFHIADVEHRQKLRVRKYGPNGVMDDKTNFLEIKQKEATEVHKSRVQLDEENLENIKKGNKLDLSDDLHNLNRPLYSYSNLNKFVNKYNKLVDDYGIGPVLVVNYHRLAYGKGSFRLTIDTNITSYPVNPISLSEAYKIRKSVDWTKVQQYKDKFSNNKNAVLEIKFNSSMPKWTKDLLDKYDLQSEKFSKYVFCTYSSIKML